MTRLLVVHPDPRVVQQRATALVAAGYSVESCSGPAGSQCPVLTDEPCPLLDRADALVYDAGLGSPEEMRFLIAHLREEYADLPLLVIGADASASWTELDGPHRVWQVPADASREQLTSVIEEALTEQGMAV
jgi:hypothetical protein